MRTKISKIAGVLIVLGIIVGILSIVPAVESETFLETAAANQNQIIIGGIFQFFLIPIYIGFSLLLYPILKPFNTTLSIGFIGFRFMAGTFQLIGIIALPLFVLLSQNYSTAALTDIAIYESAGDLLRLFRDLTNHLGVILATGLGNILFYIILYKEKMIPKWLSISGFIGNLLIMVASFLIISQLIEVISIAYALLSIPLVLQDIILAIWLFFKGLNIQPSTQPVE